MIDTPLPKLKIRGRELLPIIQGGMGVGVSAHKLAGTVAREGAIGTIASIDLRVHHPDLMERTKRVKDRAIIDEANYEALDREIKAAREIAGPDGFIASNVMRAVDRFPELVKQSCESGANAIIMGAGLPFELPELTKDYPDVRSAGYVPCSNAGCARACCPMPSCWSILATLAATSVPPSQRILPMRSSTSSGCWPRSPRCSRH
jgi:NAD(P)H-dependent flavin oxidoreductase YrpB (nitropropane dioxygenase family)